MGFFQKRRLGKLARTLVLVTALSTACASKSEKFVQLVASGDKDTAAQLIKNPQKKKEWEMALASIVGIQRFLESNGITSLKFLKNRPRIAFNTQSLWQSLIILFDEGLEGASYQQDIRGLLRDIRGAGLDDTAHDWEKRLIDYYLNYDKILADGLNEDLAVVKKYTGERRARYPEVLRKYGILELMQPVLPKARKAGFTKTADAIQDALIELRATFL